MKARWLGTAMVVGLLVALAAPASAITDAQLDGSRHPYVVALIGHPPEGGLAMACSGVLIAPRIVLTAGHCTEGLSREPERPFVTNAPVFDPRTSKLRRITALVTHPAFDPIRLLNDLGVVILAKPVRGIVPASLPEANLLGDMASAGTLPEELTMVSYGVFVDCSVRPCAFVDDGARRVAFAGAGVVRGTVFNVMNGVCSHDSGSPQLLPSSNEAVGITNMAFGCAATGQAVRLDTPQARSFIGRFAPLP